MDVTERLHEDTLILLVSGKVNYYSRKVFQAVIKNASACGARRLLVDLSGVTWMDSTGLGLLALAYLECERRRVGLSLVGVHPPVREMMERTNLCQLIPVFATEAQALRHPEPAHA